MRTDVPRLLIVAVLASGAVAAENGGASSPVTIRVLPARVYPAVTYKVALETEGERAGVYWSWSATGGELLSDGDRAVFWRSPPRPGDVTLRVVGFDPGGDEVGAAELDVVVHEPSTEGMVLIPAGTFIMGDTWTDTSSPDVIPTIQNIVDKPPRPVHLEAYWIDRHKVTNRQFAEFLNDFIEQGIGRVVESADMIAAIGLYEGVDVPFYFLEIDRLEPGGRAPKLRRALEWDGRRFTPRAGTENHPVMDVTWSGAVTYAFYLGRRLPTEAEWERAARGDVDDGRRYPWGHQQPTPYHANINAFFGDSFVDIGTFSPLGDSPHGVSDILGGFEWVDDWFGIHYFEDVASDVPLRNPRGPMWGFDRVIRGVAVYNKFFGDRLNLEPLSFRYQWVFEFEHGHLFAHKDTGFRTALDAADR